MKTPKWIINLGAHAGELYVAAELSKRAIPNALLPQNFSDHDIIFGGKNGKNVGFAQVKACHPDRSNTFYLKKKQEEWANAADNEYVVFVWLGSTKKEDNPVYWIAKKKEVGLLCVKVGKNNKTNDERRLAPDIESNLNKSWKYESRLPREWRNNWDAFNNYSVN